MSGEIDTTQYARPPKLDATSGLALARALAAAAPKTATNEVKRARAALVRAAESLEAALARRSGTESTLEDQQPYDVALDACWSALAGRIECTSRLPVNRWPKAFRAAELSKILFPSGLGFLSLPYEAEWAESERRLKVVAKLNLAADIRDLAGPEFLDAVEEAHAAYGKALGLAPQHPSAPDPRLLVAEPLREVQRSISQYTVAVLAMLDPEDSASTSSVREALAPLDLVREAARP
jgi:hypothetical protein